jgi:hypothetical protein
MYRLRLTEAIIVVLAILAASTAGAKERGNAPQFDFLPRNGDLVFQTSKSQLGPALEIATGSVITHVGVIFIDSDTVFVYEAVGPVRRVPLERWIGLGVERMFCVKRLKNADEVLTPDALKKMEDVYSKLEGRDYDVRFEWSDDRLYCSELVYKMYKKGADIELGRIEKFGGLKLDDPLVQFWINMYFPEGPNLDEEVVSPVSIFNDTLLVSIYSNY